MKQAQLLALATAHPRHEVRQEDVEAVARKVFTGREREFEHLRPVFKNSGIARRHSVMPLDWYRQDRTWPERTEVYLEAATELFSETARAALARAGLGPADVDGVVTVSSTGIATPSLEARAMAAMGFRDNLWRTPVFGLGCAGGVTGLSIAARLAQARPGSIVLMVCVELCTLAFRLDELSSANLVASALFGDGAAACVVSTDGPGLRRIEASAEHTWPDTLGIMGWRVDPQGFGVIFDRSIPSFAAARMREAMEWLLARMDLTMEDVGRFVCHPGGAKVLEALESALDLGQGALAAEREVLADNGNMSAPTVLFVLDRLLAAGGTPPRMVLSALGPGFTASCLSLVA